MGLEQREEGGHETEGIEGSTQGPVSHFKEFCLHPKSIGNHCKILSNGGWVQI